MSNELDRVFVAGHLGMVGSSIFRQLLARGYRHIVTRTREELDLLSQAQVNAFFSSERIDQVYLAAARVGGIHANSTYPAEFIYNNLMVQTNVIHAAHVHGVRKLLFLGSSCIYPRLARQPMSEDELMLGKLEPTNEPYAIAKIAGIKMCESYNRQYFETHGTDYRSVMPTNLYGPGDNYHPTDSHVVPALIRRFHEAKENGAENVLIWGSGSARREFLHVDDLAAACVHIMELSNDAYRAHTQPMQSHVNVGSGSDLPIKELAELIKRVVAYRGAIAYDITKPDGTPRKLLDSSLVRKLGWEPRLALEDGLRMTYEDFLRSQNTLRS